MANIETERGYYMVRAMDQTEKQFSLLFEDGVVAVGWSEVDLRNLSSKAEIDEVLRDTYGFWHRYDPRVRGRKKNEILRFNNIREGDRILVPYYSSVALATATGGHRHVSEQRQELDLANQAEVDYMYTDDGVMAVPRDELSEGLARRLRVRGSTVSDLREFADEIEALFTGRSFTWRARLAREDEDRRANFRKKLLANIRQGRTNLRTGGYGLEELVAELLRLEGYDASILSKRTFQGQADADIEASRSDRFSEQKLLVQVKHHEGNSGTRGLQQLLAIEDEGHVEYSDYRLILVTTGDVGDELRDRALAADVDVLDGEDLMDWLLDNFDELDAATRRTLGISRVPELML